MLSCYVIFVQYSLAFHHGKTLSLDYIRLNRPHPAHIEENIAAADDNVHEYRGETIRRRSG